MHRVSVIVPMFNEAAHVDRLVDDIAAQDFEGEVELLFADGGSTDGSADRVQEAARRLGLEITVLKNEKRIVSPGLNACLQHATGELIVRLDCHSRYPADYIRRCVDAAETTGAWNVGGVMVAEGRTPMERAVACAMESPFGGIGWTRHGSEGERVEVDTVTYGAFRPEAFERAGTFDESLTRNQDDEFNLRLRRAGGRVVLDPAIRVHYTPRGSLRAVFRQYWEYGLWKVPVMLKHRRVLTARSLAPSLFVFSTAALALASLWSPIARVALAVEFGAYAAFAIAFAALSVRARREPWALVPRTAAVFPAFHLGYGLGMLRGWLRAAVR